MLHSGRWYLINNNSIPDINKSTATNINLFWRQMAWFITLWGNLLVDVVTGKWWSYLCLKQSFEQSTQVAGQLHHFIFMEILFIAPYAVLWDPVETIQVSLELWFIIASTKRWQSWKLEWNIALLFTNICGCGTALILSWNFAVVCYTVSVLLSNTHMGGNQISFRFSCLPPDLEDYLALPDNKDLLS